MKYYQDLIRKISVSKAGKEEQERAVRNKLKQDVWEQVIYIYIRKLHKRRVEFRIEVFNRSLFSYSIKGFLLYEVVH